MVSLIEHVKILSEQAHKHNIKVLIKDDCLEITYNDNKLEINYNYNALFESFSFEINNTQIRNGVINKMGTLSIHKDDVLQFIETIFSETELTFLKEIPNIVTDKFKMDPITLEFLIQTSFASLSSTRRDNIYNPKCSIDYSELMTQVGKYGDVSCMSQLMEVIKEATTDSELLVLVGPQVYEFLRFIIDSNKTDMVSSEIEFTTTIEEKTTTGEIIKINYYKKTEGIQTFAIKYPSYIEDKFNVQTPEYFFHGSGIENWHSILRNGIKNASGTKLQVNGAAFGSGVYLGADATTSYGYCRGKIIAMGVVQVLGDYKQWLKQANNFLVVNDDTVLLLRYIVFFKKIGVSSEFGTPCNAITKYFRETLKFKKQSAMISFGQIARKRISGEIKRVDIKLKGKVKIEVNKSNIRNLVATMIFPENRVKEIKVNIMLPNNFPSSPPKIALKSPKLNGLMDIATPSGGIIMKKLCGNIWKPSNTFCNIFAEIYEHFLDKNYSANSLREYDFDEAIESFYEVQKANGWH